MTCDAAPALYKNYPPATPAPRAPPLPPRNATAQRPLELERNQPFSRLPSPTAACLPPLAVACSHPPFAVYARAGPTRPRPFVDPCLARTPSTIGTGPATPPRARAGPPAPPARGGPSFWRLLFQPPPRAHLLNRTAEQARTLVLSPAPPKPPRAPCAPPRCGGPAPRRHAGAACATLLEPRRGHRGRFAGSGAPAQGCAAPAGQRPRRWAGPRRAPSPLQWAAPVARARRKHNTKQALRPAQPHTTPRPKRPPGRAPGRRRPRRYPRLAVGRPGPRTAPKGPSSPAARAP
jgi:hypothetical protein